MKNNIIRIIPNPFYDFIAYMLPGTILFFIILEKIRWIYYSLYIITITSTVLQIVLVGLLILAIYFLGVIISSISPFFYKLLSSLSTIIPDLKYNLCEENIVKRKDEITPCLKNLGYNFIKKINNENKSLVREICKRFLRLKHEKMADLIGKRDTKIILIENMTIIWILFSSLYYRIIKDILHTWSWLLIIIILLALIISHVVQIKARAKELVYTFLTCASLEIK